MRVCCTNSGRPGAVEKILPIRLAQMLTCLKLSAKPVGLLINFNVPQLRQGLRRVSYEHAPDEDLG
jgi:PD-(D/E)XK nuclease superfamily protein